ncbi:MAG: dihydrofolate reductase [Opitutaceae bacterium]
MTKPLTLIVACSENRVIGRDGKLPFHIPEDQQWFHEKTAHQTVVLGRICFETWPRVLTNGREPVVITSQPERIHKQIAHLQRAPQGYGAKPVHIAAQVTAALALAQKLPGDIMICGGQRIYEETIPLAQRILLTLVHTEVPGDTYFPEWRQSNWRETWRRESRDAHYRYTFLNLER